MIIRWSIIIEAINPNILELIMIEINSEKSCVSKRLPWHTLPMFFAENNTRKCLKYYLLSGRDIAKPYFQYMKLNPYAAGG